MWHGHYAWSSWPMVAGGFLFWGGMIGLVLWGVLRSTRHTEGSANDRRSPLDLLKQRYAAGEISKEQFDEIRRDLMS